MKKLNITLIVLMFVPFGLFAQTEIARFLSSGVSDVEKLTEAYMLPFGKGFGTAMNAGWYNTAAPHKFMGFDFTVQSTLVSVPSVDGSFDLDSYSWNLLNPSSSSISSTISGTGSGANIGVKYGDSEINDLYELPKGMGFNIVPLPMIQLSVGVLKGTDVTLRLFPELEIGDFGKIGMIGFGVKHDIKQWIPVIQKLPFDLSIQGAWSRLSGTYSQVNYYPTDIITTSFEYVDPLLPTNATDIANDYYRTQDLTLITNAWNANLIVSKKMSVLTVFASVGYSSSNFNIGLNGNYLIPEFIPSTDDAYNAADDTNSDGIVTVLDSENDVTDPIDVNIKYSSINASVGLRLQLALVAFHATYVHQDYSMINFGLGISFK